MHIKNLGIPEAHVVLDDIAVPRSKLLYLSMDEAKLVLSTMTELDY